MKAFVTGSTGLLGNALVRRLEAEGHEVTALVRSPEKAERILGDTDARIVVGDVTDVGEFADELRGHDVLFHAAAYFREYYGVGDHTARLRAVNVDATVDLLVAAEEAGVGRAVHVSSSGTVGPRRDGSPSDESDCIDPTETENYYFRSKVLAERAVEQFLDEHEMDVVMVLPGVMVGPGDAAPTVMGRVVLDLVAGRVFAIPEGGLSFVDVRDVAEATVAAAERGARGERYVVGGRYRTMAEFAATVGRLTGVRAPRRVLPYRVGLAVGLASELAARVRGGDPLVSRAAVHSVHEGVELSSAKAKRELGVTFRPLEETLRDEVEWFREHGYLDAATAAHPSGQTTAVR
ncbi:NAD-dependent epimerase/dehydratase family protein [Halogeometricum limi]|uniref:Dihydroflavonol-4-reductase n=1 Tax=Halogeometricum limi TaxID=555875 RepID=A0A1I6HZ56_9EURY|nr:NAD-dependent epimerase/dehydratase family protein [Halogeometricum limi]SFR59490.1 dihydroflavonol-4-reductase [Halogeometricum limi]